LNGGLHAVSFGKPSEWMSKFVRFDFLKTESEQNFGSPHIPIAKYIAMTHLSPEVPLCVYIVQLLKLRE